MCIYPRLLINKKYRSTKKNKGNVPKLKDERIKYVPVGCGYCFECRKKKANEWKIRLSEEIKYNKEKAIFITLTFSEEELNKLIIETAKTEGNSIATLAVRRFLERWRKKYKKSIKHWLITELGHKNTQRIHLHGIIWADKTDKEIQNIWKYGNIYCGKYVNENTIKYITKYVTKVDTDHKNYQPIILCSSGIGGEYTKHCLNKYKGDETNEIYKFKNGAECQIPIYYRNKLYTEDQRENLWIIKLDKGERWVNGVKVDADNTEEIERLLKEAQALNKRLGYPTNDNYKKEEYNAKLIDMKELRKIKYQAWKNAKDEKDYYNLIKQYKQLKFKFL